MMVGAVTLTLRAKDVGIVALGDDDDGVGRLSRRVMIGALGGRDSM